MGVWGSYFCGINFLEIELTESKAHLFLSVIDTIKLPIKMFYQPKIPKKVNKCAYFPPTLWILYIINPFHFANLLVCHCLNLQFFNYEWGWTLYVYWPFVCSSVNYLFMFFACFCIGLLYLVEDIVIKW